MKTETFARATEITNEIVKLTEIIHNWNDIEKLNSPKSILSQKDFLKFKEAMIEKYNQRIDELQKEFDNL